MRDNPVFRLTRVQREILEALNNGAIITVDRMNLAHLGDREVQPSTRYFLTRHRLVTRVDQSKSVETQGNGFVITELGRQVLQMQAIAKGDNTEGIGSTDSANRALGLERRTKPASERQLAFADSLGLIAPKSLTMEEASFLLTTFGRVKHYIYGLWRDLTGLSAAECNLPRLEVETFAAELVNTKRDFADMIAELVGERDSAEFLSNKTDPVFQQMGRLLAARWSQYWPRRAP